MDNYYPRHCAERLARLAAGFPAVVVTGARQAGKTTLLRRAFPEHHYVSLDLPSVADQAERNPDLFLRNHPPPVLVDEVQYAPGLFRHLKAAIDVRRHEMGRFVLTGSQHFTLMKGVSESLAGRCGLLELENLALAEIGGVTEVPSDAHSLAALMSRGQFPELWRLRELSARDYFSSYLATYLERDVRQILRVGSLRDFERFLRVLAARPAAMLNRSDVARDVGITGKTVGEWLSVLETSGQIALLEPWYANFGKRLVKTPKVYFRDTGLLCFLLNLDGEGLLASPLLGPVWETFVFAEMRKLNETRGRPFGLWYYRDLGGREADFVLESQGKLSFVECKWQERPGRREAKSLLRVDAERRAAGRWGAGEHYVVGRPAASSSLMDGVAAIGIRDLPIVFEGCSPLTG